MNQERRRENEYSEISIVRHSCSHQFFRNFWRDQSSVEDPGEKKIIALIGTTIGLLTNIRPVLVA